MPATEQTKSKGAIRHLLAVVGLFILLACDPRPAGSEVLMFKPAELVWAEYRREDLGFRIEMPGKPQIAVGNDPALKETIVELSYDVVTFSVTVLEFQKA